MGIIELLLERLSVTSVLLGTVALYIIYKIYVDVDKSIRLRRLPGVPSAPKPKTKLPLGMYDFQTDPSGQTSLLVVHSCSPTREHSSRLRPKGRQRNHESQESRDVAIHL